MAVVTSYFGLFVVVKMVGVMAIVGLYRRIRSQSVILAKAGQCIIIIMMLFVVGNNIIQIASAESTDTGTVTLVDESIYSNYGFGTSSSVAHYFDQITFDYSNYNVIYKMKVTNFAASQFSRNAESTTFDISAPNSGSGIVSYSKNDSSITWWFAADGVITSSPIVMTYASNIFANVSITPSYNTATVSVTSPACIRAATGKCLGSSQGVGGANLLYYADVGKYVTNSYSVSYTNSGGHIVANAYVTKNSYLGTHINFSNISGIKYASEPAGVYGTTPYNPSFEVNNQIWIEISTSSGTNVQHLINSSIGCAGCIPIIVPTYPVTGANIYFDRTQYTIGDTANISYYISNSTYNTWLSICRLSILENGAEMYREPVASQHDDFLYTPQSIGILTANIDCGITVFDQEIVGTGSVNVVSEGQSFLFLPSSITTGKITSIGYKLGYQTVARVMIKTQVYNPGNNNWIDENSYAIATSIDHKLSNVIYNQSIILRNQGTYRISIFDEEKNKNVASASIQSIAVSGVPQNNLTVSNISIINRIQVYQTYDTIQYAYRVDTYNFSRINGTVSVEMYSPDGNNRTIEYYLQSDLGTGSYVVSQTDLAGIHKIRLVSTNTTNKLILSEDTITISAIDAEGFGLSILNARSCYNQKNVITAVSPGNATLEIQTTVLNKFNFFGTKTFDIYPKSDVYIYLKVNNSLKRYLALKLDTPANCNINATGALPPADKIAVDAVDSWVLSFGMGLSATSKFIFAIIITILIAVVTLIVSKSDGNVTALITFGSYAIFSWIHYIPSWVFIIVILLIAIYAKLFR